MKIRILFSLLIIQLNAFGQDSVFIRKIFTEALDRGKAYSDLRELCKNIGPRLSGSANAEMAIDWSEAKFKSYKF
ncbi:MAG: peptidase M28 family protein, partial [Bacteroidetes bacterium]|nr:peptidase M28 family protein [Bacteroidota bacterium]